MKGKLVVFLIGLVAGALGAILLPPRVGPYLPAALSSAAPTTEGEVVAKEWRDGRLLLTLLTGEGATLATFSEQVPEINLLVEPGDLMSFDLEGYRPFVENPPIRRVRKGVRPEAPTAISGDEAEKAGEAGETGETGEAGEEQPAAAPETGGAESGPPPPA